MSRKDFDKYVFSLQNQVNKMNDALKKANELIDSEQISENVYNYIALQQKALADNYANAMYYKFLLDKKPAWLEKLLGKKTTAQVNRNLDAMNKKYVQNVKDKVEKKHE